MKTIYDILSDLQSDTNDAPCAVADEIFSILLNREDENRALLDCPVNTNCGSEMANLIAQSMQFAKLLDPATDTRKIGSPIAETLRVMFFG